MALLGQLLAGVAHDINTPMGALNSNNNLLIRLIQKLKEIIDNSPLHSKLGRDHNVVSIFENIDKLCSVNEEAINRMVVLVQSLRGFARLDQAEIEDSGEGIPANHINSIFDAGFTTKESGSGTGLGLSIVKRIIDDHKGTISVKSEMGKGTTFRIVLPYEMNETSTPL